MQLSISRNSLSSFYFSLLNYLVCYTVRFVVITSFSPLLLCSYDMSIKKDTQLNFSFSQAGHRGPSARLCLLVVIPPIPLNLVITRSYASDKLTLSSFTFNAKKRETPLCHHNEISLILIESVQLSFAFQPALSAPQN